MTHLCASPGDERDQRVEAEQELLPALLARVVRKQPKPRLGVIAAGALPSLERADRGVGSSHRPVVEIGQATKDLPLVPVGDERDRALEGKRQRGVILGLFGEPLHVLQRLGVLLPVTVRGAFQHLKRDLRALQSLGDHLGARERIRRASLRVWVEHAQPLEHQLESIRVIVVACLLRERLELLDVLGVRQRALQHRQPVRSPAQLVQEQRGELEARVGFRGRGRSVRDQGLEHRHAPRSIAHFAQRLVGRQREVAVFGRERMRVEQRAGGAGRVFEMPTQERRATTMQRRPRIARQSLRALGHQLQGELFARRLQRELDRTLDRLFIGRSNPAHLAPREERRLGVAKAIEHARDPSKHRQRIARRGRLGPSPRRRDRLAFAASLLEHLAENREPCDRATAGVERFDERDGRRVWVVAMIAVDLDETIEMRQHGVLRRPRRAARALR